MLTRFTTESGALMDAKEFWDKLSNHPTLTFMGVNETGILIKQQHPDNVAVFWELDPKSVKDQTWEMLEGVLTCKRNARQLMKMSRIVGYFSRINNWNKSKLAELSARHRGDYGIESNPVRQGELRNMQERKEQVGSVEDPVRSEIA